MAKTTNRWGEAFAKGDLVKWGRSASGEPYTGRYIKLAPTDAYARAYGRSALVWLGRGPLPVGFRVVKDGLGYLDDNVVEVNLNDLSLVKKPSSAAKQGSRSKVSVTELPALAYFDSMRSGLVPIKALRRVQGNIEFVVTAKRYGYPKGHIDTAAESQIIPRKAVYTKNHQHRILPYKWS